VDQLNIEKLGIPTVSIATTQFAGLAKLVARAEGMQNACFVQVPHPLGMLPQAEVEAKAERAFPSILKALTEWEPPAPVEAVKKDPYPAETFELTGGIGYVNQCFLENRWSLGLPLLPPTPESVAEMLKGTSRNPADVLGQAPPRMGTLTVELAAVHAVMAGCRPEYMPLLLAALDSALLAAARLRFQRAKLAVDA